MANIRQTKKMINSVIYDIVEASYSAQLFNDKKTDASNKIIDAAAAVQDDLLGRINKVRSKKDFPAIIADFEKNADDLYDQVSKL